MNSNVLPLELENIYKAVPKLAISDRQMIEHPGATLPGFDQYEWARLITVRPICECSTG